MPMPASQIAAVNHGTSLHKVLKLLTPTVGTQARLTGLYAVEEGINRTNLPFFPWFTQA